MYAVNISDLTRDKLLGELLVAPVIPRRRIVTVKKGVVDGDAVLLECDDDQASAICEVIRRKWAKNLFRCYVSKTGKAWKSI